LQNGDVLLGIKAHSAGQKQRKRGKNTKKFRNYYTVVGGGGVIFVKRWECNATRILRASVLIAHVIAMQS
jgi:hypothetical protein